MSDRLDGAGAGWRRVFPHHSAVDLEAREHQPWLIGRLLEEGDTNDLRWLIDRVGEDEIAGWVRQRGQRQLSPRSRSFWARVLNLDMATFEEDPLWPI